MYRVVLCTMLWYIMVKWNYMFYMFLFTCEAIVLIPVIAS